jgi:quercetin dioxygenase-like cupin family protein
MHQHIVPPGHGPAYDWSQDLMAIKAPLDLSDGRVTVAEDTLKPGFHLPPHRHRSMAEIFYILEGEVTFTFVDEVATATPGTTVTVPAGVSHDVACPLGGRLLTIFTPGGFERYLAELAALSPAQLNDAATVRELGERYDIWPD